MLHTLPTLRPSGRLCKKFPLVLILALALGLRLYQLGHESLWYDEGYSISNGTIDLIEFDRMRPIYFLLLRFWIQFGTSEFWLRLPAVFFGVAGIAVLYAIACRLADERVAVIAGLLMALSLPQIDHSQEVRMYTMAAFLLLCSFYLLLRWLETGVRWRLAAHVVLGWLAIATTPVTLVGVLFAGAIALYTVRTHKRMTLLLVAAYVPLALLWIPFASVAFQMLKSFRIGSGGWLEPPSPYSLIGIHSQFLLNHLKFQNISSPYTAGALGGILLTCLFLPVIAVVNRSRESAARNARWIALWYYSVLMSVYFFSILQTPVWRLQYLLPLAPAYYLLVAMGLVSIARRSEPLAWIVLAFILCTILPRLNFYYSSTTREPWREAAHWTQQHAKKGDVVCVVDRRGDGYIPLRIWQYYYRGSAPTYSIEFDIFSGEKASERTAQEILRKIPPHTGRTWLVLRRNKASTRSELFGQIENLFERQKTPDLKFVHNKIEVLCLDLHGKGERENGKNPSLK